MDGIYKNWKSFSRTKKSSQTIESDNSIYFEDGALIYVRDKNGVLHSPPGYSKSNLTSSAKYGLSTVIHGATCAIKTGTSQESPCNLYQICKNFVAKNLHLVESLVDFPETIGHDLFLEALRMQTFHKSPDYLNIFCVAYESLVLEHLSLRQSIIVINENLNFLECFNSLTKLDLSHCRLGDNHEYLTWIGKMKSLEYIGLKDNCLTDNGILAWTLPHRMFHSGPELLRTLDLSCNPGLTDSCVKCVVKYPHLESLNLSGTKVTIATGVKQIMKLTQLKMVSYIPEFSKETFVKTKGWASPFILELSSRSKDPKSDGCQGENPNRNLFYKLAGLSAFNASESKVKRNRLSSDDYPVMLLQKEELILPDTLRSINSELSATQSKKRMGIDSGIVSLMPVKRQKIKIHTKEEDKLLPKNEDEELSVDDINLLDSYLKYLS